MHITTATLKNGQILRGYVWKVNLEEGWFTLAGSKDGNHKVMIADCESVITENERISRTKHGDADELERWKKIKAYKIEQNKHIGGSFKDFLDEEGIREEVEAEATKRARVIKRAQRNKPT